MKLVAVTRVLDEEDILEAFVRHTASSCAAHIFLDNGSGDHSLAILRALKREGLDISVFQNKSVTYTEEDFNTFLYREALAQGADWVVFLDADEFIDDRALAGGLGGELERLGAAAFPPVCIKVPLVDYESTERDDAAEAIVPVRIRHRRMKSDNLKVIVRASPDPTLRVASGSHAAFNADGALEPTLVHPHLAYAHYSERSPYIWIRKFVKGWAKILASQPAVKAHGHSNHYRGPYEAMLRDPRSILGDQSLMHHKNQGVQLSDDPIHYKGGPLRHSPPWDEKTHTIGSLLGYLTELANQHSHLIASSPEAARVAEQFAARIERLS